MTHGADAGIPPLTLILQSIPPAKAIYTAIAILLVVCALFPFLCAHPSHIQACQTAQGVNSSHDDLIYLFKSIERFLKPLEIYSQVPPTPTTDDMIVKIMVELLSTLALMTKEFKEGRSSESCSPGCLALTQWECREIHKEDCWRKGHRGGPTKAGSALPERGSKNDSRDSQGSLRSRPGHE
jgi:hypothetical protein